MIWIDWATYIIHIPKGYMTLTQANPAIYELDLNQLRLDLKAIEYSFLGMPQPNTHVHNTEVTLSGATYARTFQIISPYTVTFEDDQYAVEAVGANSNLADVTNVNQVSIRSFNSAGLITVTSGSGVTAQDKEDIATEVWNRMLSQHTIPGSTGKKLSDDLTTDDFAGMNN